MEKIPSSGADRSRKIIHLYGLGKVITVITRVRHWSLSRARRIQSTPSYSLL